MHRCFQCDSDMTPDRGNHSMLSYPKATLINVKFRRCTNAECGEWEVQIPNIVHILHELGKRGRETTARMTFDESTCLWVEVPDLKNIMDGYCEKLAIWNRHGRLGERGEEDAG